MVIRLLCSLGLKFVLIYILVVIVFSIIVFISSVLCVIIDFSGGRMVSVVFVVSFSMMILFIVLSFGICWIGIYSSSIVVLVRIIIVLKLIFSCLVILRWKIFYGLVLRLVCMKSVVDML